MAPTFEQIIENIKNKRFNKLYFLMGEEPYFIDKISDLIEDTAIPEENRDFNQKVFFGRETTVRDVVCESRMCSFIPGMRVIIVKEAQDMKDIEELDKFLDKLTDDAIIVFCYKYKKLDKRKSLAKNLEKSGAIIFESKKLYDNNIPAWIRNIVDEMGLSINEKSCQLLADYLGNNLNKIRQELEKLRSALPKGKKTIDEGLIEYNIGISKEFNIFELQNALAMGDMVRTTRIIEHFANNTKESPIIFTTVMLYSFFTKILKVHYSVDKSDNGVAQYLEMTPFIARNYINGAKRYSIAQCVACIASLRDIDKKAKGYGSSTASEKELYYELLHKLTRP